MALTNIINLLILVHLTAFATMVTSEVYSDDLDLEQFPNCLVKEMLLRVSVIQTLST